MVRQFMFRITEDRQSSFFDFLSGMGDIVIFPAVSDTCEPVTRPVAPVETQDAVFMSYALVAAQNKEKVQYEKSCRSDTPQKYELRPFDDDLRPIPLIEYSISSSERGEYDARIVLNPVELPAQSRKELKSCYETIKNG